VKSCGSDISTLISSWRQCYALRWRRRQESPIAGKSTKQPLKPFAQGMPEADSNGRRNTKTFFTHGSSSSSASAGVFQPSVFLGRALRAAATADISLAL